MNCLFEKLSAFEEAGISIDLSEYCGPEFHMFTHMNSVHVKYILSEGHLAYTFIQCFTHLFRVSVLLVL